MMNLAVTVSEAATDAREVASRLASCVPMTDFDAERQARILDGWPRNSPRQPKTSGATAER
jgi:hypothetical protein